MAEKNLSGGWNNVDIAMETFYRRLGFKEEAKKAMRKIDEESKKQLEELTA